MPPAITSMHPTLVVQPFHHEGWLYEEKVDGYRVLAYKAGETWQEVLESKGRPGS